MNTATETTVADFDHSLNLTIDLVKALRLDGKPQAILLATIKEKLNDEKLFVPGKRAAALKRINKALGTSFTLTQVAKAGTPKPAATKPEEPAKALHTDQLLGTVDVPVTPKADSISEGPYIPKALELAEKIDAVTSSVHNIDRLDRDNHGLLVSTFLRESPSVLEEWKVAVNLIAGTDLAEKIAPELLAFSLQGVTNEHLAANYIQFVTHEVSLTSATEANTQAPNESQELTQENDMNNAAQATNTTATPIRKAASAEFVALLGQHKIQTEQQFRAVFEAFMPTIANDVEKFVRINLAHPELDHFAVFETFLKTDKVLEERFNKFLLEPATIALIGHTTQAAAADASWTQRAMQGLRGKRESGFSSGVVAAAAAVVGGGAEMFFRGGLSIAGGVGTAVGAVGGYFAAEAAEKLMESDTGRYILSGSIGLIAGGVGASLGRTVQGQFFSGLADEAVDAAVPAVNAPAPAATPSTAGFVPMYGL